MGKRKYTRDWAQKNIGADSGNETVIQYLFHFLRCVWNNESDFGFLRRAHLRQKKNIIKMINCGGQAVWTWSEKYVLNLSGTKK
jgi:hypothetical protein